MGKKYITGKVEITGGLQLETPAATIGGDMWGNELFYVPEQCTILVDTNDTPYIEVDSGELYLTNLTDPSSDTDAATKAYVDDNAGTKLYKHTIAFSSSDWPDTESTHYLTRLVIINNSSTEITSSSLLYSALQNTGSILTSMSVYYSSLGTTYSYITPLQYFDSNEGDLVVYGRLGTSSLCFFLVGEMSAISSDTVAEL